MLCAIDNPSGLITLTGPMTPLQLNSVTGSVTAHYIESLIFPVRTTPPTLLGTFIQEVKSEANTCKDINGNRGELVGIQICNTTHTGYKLPGSIQEPIAELILSFHVKSFSKSSVYHGILLCLPIYEAIPSQQHHHEYLTAVITGSMNADTANFPSLSSLFYSSDADTSQVSLSYKTCVEVKDTAQASLATEGFSTRSIAVLVFPHGIHIASNIIRPFVALKTPKPFQLSSTIRDNKATASKYTFNNGVKNITETSSDGVLYKFSIACCNDDFKNRIEYFTRPPPIPSVSRVYAKSRSYKTSQYKCVPFDKLTQLSTDGTVNPTLESVLKSQKTVQDFQDATRTTSGVSPEQMEGIIAGSIIIAGVIAGAIYAVHYRTST